jgi:spore coat polysaccharide biosynthesis protein SpsF
MRIVGVVQARMSSERLPGKVLHRVNNKPLIGYLIERLRHCERLDDVVVATSTDESDTVLVDYCRENSILSVRGPLDDVAGRFVQFVDQDDCTAFVRINGDSPLIDQTLIDRAVSIFASGDFDLVTNVLKRTFPKGQSVEVVKTDSFRTAYGIMTSKEDREHVTKYFYANSERFKILNLESGENFGHIQLSVDTSEDMDMFQKLIDKMDRPHWHYGYEETVRHYLAIRGGGPIHSV